MQHEFPWLPVGYALPGGATVGSVKADGAGYQIVSSKDDGRFVFLTEDGTDTARWLTECVDQDLARPEFLDRRLVALVTTPDAEPVRVADIPKRRRVLSSKEAMDLLRGLRAMAKRYPEASWADAVFLPRMAACLPILADASEQKASLAFRLLTGGVENTRMSPTQIRQFNPWLTEDEITDFLEGFGLSVGQTVESRGGNVPDAPFSLPGRPELQRFFQEYVIEHDRLKERYDAMKVKPPNGILLHGPPGSGKTYAVQKLADHLGWPVFRLGMGEVGSPFIHETSVRLNDLFSEAAEAAPSIVIVDEVDAVAGARQGIWTGHSHKIEEVSELLKSVEAAADNGVIVVATTNRKDAVDPAFLRKGRFDHVFEIDYPNAEEVLEAMEALIRERPHVEGLGLAGMSERLAGRPMSDVAWVVNEAARLAVREAKDAIDDICLFKAISNLT